MVEVPIEPRGEELFKYEEKYVAVEKWGYGAREDVKEGRVNWYPGEEEEIGSVEVKVLRDNKHFYVVSRIQGFDPSTRVSCYRGIVEADTVDEVVSEVEHVFDKYVKIIDYNLSINIPEEDVEKEVERVKTRLSKVLWNLRKTIEEKTESREKTLQEA